MNLPATQLLNDDDDDSLSSQSLNSSQITPKRVHQVANLCIGNKKYPLFRGINKIGRHPACDVCINDLSVSKNHAEIEIKSNCYYICDLKSSNKTRIDNESLRPDRFYQILDGSKLTFGIINAQFLLLRDSNDSIIVPETPAPGLKLRYDGNKSSVTDSDDSIVLGTQETKDEAVFAKPTSLPIRSPSTRDARANARKKLNASIHDLETQRQSEENNDPSIFDRETQQVDNFNKKKSIYDVETQQVGENGIKNDVFDLATQRLPEEADGESDIYAMSTQQISTTDNRGIYDLETQKISVKDQASNLYDLATQQIAADDDIYDCETQRINKQFEITKSKFKKSRAPNKNPVVNKALSTAPRKNFEEVDRKQKHVSTIVDDSETDDELVDEIQSKQSSSVHQSSSGVTNISKKSKDNERTPSISVNAHHHIIAETDDEFETDDEEAVINRDSEINGRSKIDNKETFKNDAVKDSETDDEEEMARIQDKEQSNVNNDSDSETHDEISPSDIPSCVISVDKNKILNRGVDSEAESNACPSPVLVDFSKIQHPGSEQNYNDNDDDDDDDETDDDEVYMTPNQLVSPHRKVALKTEQLGIERSDTAPSVSAEPAAAVSPRNNELECDPDALTQIIPLNTNACKKINNVEDHEVCDEFEPTQLVNLQNNCKDDDETDDEESESLCREADDKNNQVSINEGKINKVNKLMTCDQDLNDAPTQLLNLETQKLQGGIEETQKLIETQRDDLESTQLIDSQAIFSSINKTKKNSPQVKASKNKTNDDSIDSIDLENTPTQVINFESSKNACELKNDNLDDKSPVIKSHGISRRASSTPLSSGKRKINFTAVKNCRVSLDKLQNVDNLNSDEEKKISHDKKKEFKSNDKLNSDSHNDSLVRNLDAMFGGSNDDELEDASPLQTQQLEEILNDVPEKLHNVNNFQKSGSQENKINLPNKKNRESQVDSGPDTQEAYFAKLSSRKKKSNILIDSQGSSSSQKSVKSQGKAAKKIVYAPGTAGFSNGVPIEGGESVPVYESPEKKFKTETEGLPDVRIAGTDANPANSTVYSSDSEEDYSSGNVVQKLKKSMAKIKAMAEEYDDGIFSNSKIIPNSSFNHTDIKLPKLKSIDDDDSSSDGEVDFARLKQLANRLLNANDKEKILTGLEKVGSSNRNKKKIQVKEKAASKVADRKSTRKRVLPQKLKSGSFVIDDDGVLNDGQDHMVPVKRPRKARKNSEPINSGVAEKAQAETKKAAAKRSKKVNDDQSLLGSSASSGTEDQKTGVEAKKKNLAKRSNKIDVEQSLLSASVSSSNEEHSTEAKKKTATKRTKKVAADQTNFDSSTSSTASSSTLNSTIVSKRSRASVMESPSTSARSRHSHRPTEMQYKIMFTGIDYERHEQAVQSLGGVISNDPITGTILVTDKVRRTLKFLCAISRGIPIVSENWITASIKSNKFIDTDHYILRDSAAEAKFGFNLKQSLIKSKEKRLLHNLTFVVTLGVNQPSFNELKNMIQVAGGKALVRAPKTWTNSYILSCEADIPKVKKLTASVSNGVKVPVVTTEFLLSGILKQELNAEEHKLSF